jgi:hypothetical protein
MSMTNSPLNSSDEDDDTDILPAVANQNEAWNGKYQKWVRE